ncbi:MAG: class I SAM-dependent methyltransferase [Rhizonema sp. PD38]|nr:class I SAM-dependent methyltransferase [Rhizonema sp. PD38]
MSDYKQRVIEFFNRRTAYDQEGSRHPREASLLLKSVQLQKGQKILDVATGTGLVAIPAAQVVGPQGYVIGVDFSPGMISQARQKTEAARLQNIEFIESDADQLNFGDRSFDVIFCCSAIMYLADVLGTLKNWYRWLKPEGVVAFSCAAGISYMAPVQIRVCAKLFGISLQHINEPLATSEKCYKLMQEAGFRNIEVKIEEAGEYVSIGDSRMSWRGEGFYPRGNVLSQLSPQQLDQLQAEYRAEVEKLATDKGIWYETTTFFAVSRK